MASCRAASTIGVVLRRCGDPTRRLPCLCRRGRAFRHNKVQAIAALRHVERLLGRDEARFQRQPYGLDVTCPEAERAWRRTATPAGDMQREDCAPRARVLILPSALSICPVSHVSVARALSLPRAGSIRLIRMKRLTPQLRWRDRASFPVPAPGRAIGARS